jgi:betaine-aldehyde dehydrogenase
MSLSHGVFVNGKMVELKERVAIESISPTDESVVGYVPAATGADVDSIVELIQPALRPWAEINSSERGAQLRSYAQVLRDNADALVEIEIADSGLTRHTAVQDLNNAIQSLEFYAGLATEIKGNTFSSPPHTLAFSERVPFGIVARIVPFNHPIYFMVHAVAATLIAGNAVIIKPPEQCSLSSLYAARISEGVLPDGVLNVVTGFGHEVGAALVAHPQIPRIGFTGSLETGRQILELSARSIKNVTLELGGKNPLIVTQDADVDLAAEVAVKGMNFTHAGQSCGSTSRVLLHSDIHDAVVDRIAQLMEKLVIGDPSDYTTDVGPLAFEAHYNKVKRYIETGRRGGAKLVRGGSRPARLTRGYFLEPALFTEVTGDMRIAREEIFGPVLSVLKWASRGEMIRLANATEFGLSSRIVAGSVSDALEIGRHVEAGTTLINTVGSRAPGMPFGGFKMSGLGKQNSLEEVLSYTQEKSYVISL